MARPEAGEEAPDSVSFGQFAGLRNTVTRERLGPADLETAKNVDLDDAGQLRRRRGFTKVANGSYHSLFTASDGTVYGAKDGSIGVIFPNYTFQSITSAGDDPIAFVQIGNTIYYSSPDVSGKIDHATKTRTEWGSLLGDTWLSPVVNPVPGQLAPTKGKLLGKPPQATVLAQMNGRIYLASKNVLWATELYNYDYVDKVKNFQQYEADITALAPVEGGMFVGTESATYFLRGPFNEMVRGDASPDGVIPGSVVYVDPKALPGDLPNSTKTAVMMMTKGGLCVGLDNGTLVNLTRDRVEFPEAIKLHSLFRQQDGVSQYVGVADSGGSPSGKMRIGDYVEAEIRRFQGA